MIVWFSGGAQQALLQTESNYSLLRDSSEQIVSLSRSELMHITEEWDDVYQLTLDTVDAVRDELSKAISNYDALLVSSLALDRNTKGDRRTAAAVEAEKLLGLKFTRKYVLNVYFAKPMPASADLIGTQAICQKSALVELRDLLRNIQLSQTQIRIVREAWDHLDDYIFDGNKNRAVFQAWAIRNGLFLELAQCFPNERRYDSLVAKWTGLNASQHNIRQIIELWISLIMTQVMPVQSSQKLFEDFVPAVGSVYAVPPRVFAVVKATSSAF